MSTPANCPDPQQYRQLLSGSFLEADQMARLVEHLELCPRCADTVHEMREADTLGKDAVPPPPVQTQNNEQAIKRPGPASTSLPTLGPKLAEAETEVARLLTPPQQEDEIGRIQRFRVLRVLGQGGMGIVLLAEDPQLPRSVALKVMRPSLAVSVQGRRRFEAEARAMAAIEHDHIVPIWHVDEEQGVPFLVMPYLRGQSLEDRLRRDGALPVGEAIRIGREIAVGLAAAHARGLIHRDVKPANIWLEERDEGPPSRDASGGLADPRTRVKLLDFGLVRAVTADAGQTLGGTLLGTPGYMAPEQIAGGQVSVASDLFSLGCVLYRLTTGCEAFHGDNVWAILRATEHDSPRPPHEIAGSVPLPLSRLILDLLAKDPANRPGSAADVIQALDAVTRDTSSVSAAILPTLTMPESSTGARTAAPPRRRRLWAAGAAAVILLLAVLLAFSSIGTRPPQTSRKDPENAKDFSLPPDSPILPGGQRFRVETLAARGHISVIAFRPRSQQVATASADGVLRLWDARDGRLVRALVPALPKGSEPRRSSLAWTADGKTLAWGLPPGIVYQIDPDTGCIRVRHENLGRIASLAWSGDGQMLAVGLEGELREIRVWSKDGWLSPLCGADVSALAFSPDGKLLAAGGSQIWDIESSKLSPLSRGLPASAQTPPSALAWSPTGDLLAIGGQLWSKADGKTRTFEREGAVALQWRNDGKQIVLATSPGEVRVHDVGTGTSKRQAIFPALRGRFLGPTAVSSDGTLLASNPANDFTFVLWDAVSGNIVRDFPGPDPLTVWRVSSDGKRLLTAFGDALALYEAPTGKLLQFVRHRGSRWLDGGFSADGKLVKVDGWLRDSNALKETHSIQGCYWCAWSAQGDRFAYVRAKQKGVCILDLASKQTHLVLPDVPQLQGLAWSPDGTKLAGIHFEFSGAIYDLRRGSKLLPIESTGDLMREVAWSPDGKWLAVLGDLRAWICDAATGKKVKVIAEKAKTTMTLAFSPDGKHLATVRSDGSVTLWDTQDWSERPLASLPPDPWIVGPYWTDNGKTLLVSMGTADIRRIDVSSGRQRGVFRPLDNARMLVVGASGHYSGTPNLRKHLVYIVQTDKGQETLTPDEFEKQFNWKNDAGKLQLPAN